MQVLTPIDLLQLVDRMVEDNSRLTRPIVFRRALAGVPEHAREGRQARPQTQTETTKRLEPLRRRGEERDPVTTPYRRTLASAFTLGLATVATQAQQDPLQTTAQKVIDEFNTLAPYIVTIGIILGGLAIMFGHSEGLEPPRKGHHRRVHRHRRGGPDQRPHPLIGSVRWPFKSGASTAP